MRAFLALAAASVLVSTSAWADTPKAGAKKSDADKVVCKREQFVGSVIPRRICMTKAQWEEGEAAAKDTMDKRQMRTDPIALSGASGG
jgi:hypothetical protein